MAVKKVPDFDPKASPADGDILPFWDAVLAKMVRMTFSQLATWIKSQLGTLRYQINIFTGFSEFYNDTTDATVEIQNVSPGPMLNSVQYRKNGGAWSSTYPFQQTPDDVIDWKVTYKPGKNSGSFTVKYRYL